MPTAKNSRGSILIVDRATKRRGNLASVLMSAGFSVLITEELYTLHQHLGVGGNFGLILLSLGLAGAKSLEILCKIHSQFPHIPVLVLATENKTHLAADTLAAGADDYILEPVDPMVLCQRVSEIINRKRVQTRRQEIVSQIKSLLIELRQIQDQKLVLNESPVLPAGLPQLEAYPTPDPARYLRFGIFTFDFYTHQIILNGARIDLTSTNFDYLLVLARHTPNPVPIKSLVCEAQGFELTISEANILARWRIHELRQSIETIPNEPQYIITVRGRGYRLVIT